MEICTMHRNTEGKSSPVDHPWKLSQVLTVINVLGDLCDSSHDRVVCLMPCAAIYLLKVGWLQYEWPPMLHMWLQITLARQWIHFYLINATLETHAPPLRLDLFTCGIFMLVKLITTLSIAHIALSVWYWLHNYIMLHPHNIK